jgi:hypothetical protein
VPIQDTSLYLAPLLIDPNSPSRTYFAGTSIWISSNNGASWSKINNGILPLSGPDGEKISAMSANSNVDIFFGTTLGRAGRVQGLGTVVDLSSGLPGYPITAVTASPDNVTAYVGFGSFDSSERIVRYNGVSWVNVTGTGLPNLPINDIVVDTSLPNTVYVATDSGVYRSQNINVASPTWARFGTGLPNVVVSGLELHEFTRTLRAATHGRGMWDILVPGTRTGPAILAAPAQLSFPNTLVNTVQVMPLTLTNTGTENVTMSALLQDNTKPFRFLSNTCPFVLTVGAYCTITVEFHPTAVNDFGTAILLNSNDPSMTQVSIGGKGVSRPLNDDFANAKVLTGGMSEFVNALLTTSEATDPIPDQPCVTVTAKRYQGPKNSNSYWYQFTPAASGTVSAGTDGSNYDTVVSMWRFADSKRTQLTQVACDDDQNSGTAGRSLISNVPVSAGTTYYIMVSSYEPGAGTISVFNFSSSVAAVSASLSPAAVNISAVTGRPLGVVPVRFNNPTAASVTVNSVTVNNGFTQSNNCGVVAAGGSCTIYVGWNGSVSGNASGTLSVSDSAGGHSAPINLSAVDFGLRPGRASRPVRSAAVPAVENDATREVWVEVAGSPRADEVLELSCEALNREQNCTVEPKSIPLAAGSAKVVVKIATDPRAARLAIGDAEVKVSGTFAGIVKSLQLPVQAGAAVRNVQRGPRGIQKR